MLPWCSGHVLLLVLGLVLAGPFRPVPLPTDFSSYDLNGDDAIDVSELANVSDTSEAQATKPFLAADTNHDGLINAEEFHSAPWDLQGTLGTRQDQKEEDEDDYMDDEARYDDEDDDGDKKDDDDDTNGDDEDDNDEDDDDDVDDNDDNEDRGIDGDDEDDDDDSNQ